MLPSQIGSDTKVNQKVNFPESAIPLNAALNEQIQQLAPAQLLWLSGYCAGLAGFLKEDVDFAAAPENVKGSQQKPSVDLAATTLIAYASQTGNAEKVTVKLAAALAQRGVEVSVTNLLKLKPKQLASYQQIILVASTHGEGEPPDNAIAFHEFLHSKRAPSLNGHRYAVLGLGDSSYEHFCQTAKDFDHRLSELGAEALLPRMDCDVDYETDAERWVEQVSDSLLSLVELNASASTTDVTKGKNRATCDWTKTNPYEAEVLVNQVITGEGSTKCIHHLEFDLGDSGIRYQPGDGLGVWPVNQPATVESLILLLQLDEDLKLVNNGIEKSVKQWLTESLELSQIHKSGLEWLLQSSENKSWLENAITNFNSFKLNHQWLDVIEQAAPSQFTAEDIFQLFRPIKPRVYSISSSPLVDEEEVHITVALAETDNDRRQLVGCASDYLIQRLEAGDKVRVFVEANTNFRPAEDNLPMIMIGPGTGIAPFRAFLQHREELAAPGKNWLFFGNPHFNTDFLYQTELQNYLQQGLLNVIDLAFSRDQEQKIYVQDKMLEKSKELWRWLQEENASVYVCGDANKMAKDVEQTLLKIISKEGNLDAQSAKEYLNNLRVENRYLRDVY